MADCPMLQVRLDELMQALLALEDAAVDELPTAAFLTRYQPLAKSLHSAVAKFTVDCAKDGICVARE